jgi:predicted GIY-YIG superfamily endonuclease
MARQWNTEGKTWYTYELINIYGTIEYVGCTYRPQYRLMQHTKCKPKGGVGKFYGRQDLTLHIVDHFENRKEALEAEGRLKSEYGMEWTERTTLISNGKKARDSGTLAEASRANWQLNWDKMMDAMKRVGDRHTQSGHIQEIGSASMARQFECPHCGKPGKGAVFFRWHGDRCKKNPVNNA